MATPIKLRVDVDMQKIITEAKRSGDAVEDLGDTFTDASDDSTDAARDTEKALDDVGDAGKDAGRQVERGMGDAADSVDDVEGSTTDLQGSLSGVGSAAKDALQGDFAGAAEGALDAVGDLTNAIPVIGTVVGAAAGVAGAAITAIASAFEDAQAAADEAKESAYQYGLVVADTGKYADVAGRINDLTGSIEGLKKVQDIATVSGWAQVDVVKALATGDGLPSLFKAFEDGANNTTIAAKRTIELEGALQGAQQGFDLATDAADVNARALYDLATSAGEATGRVDDLGNQIIRMPDGKTVVIDADTQQAYTDLDAIENKQLSTKTVAVQFQPDLAAWNRITLPTKYVQVQAQMANNLSPTGRFGTRQDLQ